MSTFAHRHCSNCGRNSLSSDKTVTFHRFPKPGKTNILKAKAWAMYCWPDEDWSTVESLKKLHKSGKVICSRHFEDDCFLDSNQKIMGKFSIPGDKTYVTNLINYLRLQDSSTKQDTKPKTFQSPLLISTPVQPASKLKSRMKVTVHHPVKQPTAANSSTKAENDKEKAENEKAEVDNIEEIVVEETLDSEEDDDVILEEPTCGVTQTENDVADQLESNLHVGYKCNVCDSDIKGFRYVCVQCADFDMCSECETGAAHSQHYVLRLPGPRPQSEILPILEKIRRELMELNVLIEDSIKEETDLVDQVDPLQEEMSSFEDINTLPDIDDDQMNSSIIFDPMDHFGHEVIKDTKQITSKISSVLPSTSNITKSKTSVKLSANNVTNVGSSTSSANNVTNMESSGSSVNITKNYGSVRPSAKYNIKSDSSAITRVVNLQKSNFIIKKQTSKELSSGKLKIVDPNAYVKVEKLDLKQILSHIRSQTTKKNE